MIHRLDFLNPTFHYGRNVTIRRGHEWYEKAQKGDEVAIMRTGIDKILAQGKIESLICRRFRDVTIENLLNEHDPECRTPAGLVYAMLRAYPDFTLDDIVTVIEFVI